MAGRLREYSFAGPEGRYSLSADGHFSHELSRRELGDLAPVPSRLETATFGDDTVVAAALRTEVSWHVNHSPTVAGKLTYNDEHDQSATAIALGGSSSEAAMLLIGFDNGEIALHRMATKKTDWFNYDMVLTSQPITAMAWLSDTQFICGHTSGEVFVHSTQCDATAPPRGTRKSMGDVALVKSKHGKSNPTHSWTLGKPASAVVAMAAAPSGQQCACGDRAGKLTIIDMSTDHVVARAPLTHFGGLNCVSWSPDGQYVAGGGEDDLVSVWSVEQKAKVACGFGHRSWITDIKFDDHYKNSATNSCHRIVSVGLDGCIVLWDLNTAIATDPAATASTAQPRKNTACLVQAGHGLVHGDPTTAVATQHGFIITACTSGKVKFWKRPSTKLEQVTSV